jgi:hypothetical protein
MVVFSGCGNQKTKYEDLPQETQKTIQAAIKKDLFTPYLEKTSQMIAISGVDQKQIIDNNIKELQGAMKRYLAKNYPEIDFTTLLERSAQMK